MAFFHYDQNNSGGHFDYDLLRGVTEHVVIEAPNALMADAMLRSIGGYFDGCESGRDCSCCGDRWRMAVGDGSPSPTIYGHAASDLSRDESVMPAGQKAVVVHYLDGRVEWF